MRSDQPPTFVVRFGRLILLIFFHLSQQCHATDLTACEQLTLAFYEDGALYYRNTQGNYVGIDKDVVEEIQRRSGCHFKTSIDSRVRIWSRLQQHSLDFSVSGIATPERNKFARFIPYFSTHNFAILRNTLPLESQTLEGFYADTSLRVAVVRGFQHGATFDAWLTRLRRQGRIQEVGDFETVIRLFLAHRIDAMLALPTGMLPLNTKELSRQIVIKDWAPDESVNFSFIMSKANVSADIGDLIEKTINDMRKDGTVDKIFREHLGPDLLGYVRTKD